MCVDLRMDDGERPPPHTTIRRTWSGLRGTRSCRWCGPLSRHSPGRWAYPARSSHTGFRSSHSYTGTCWAPRRLLHCGRLVHIWLQSQGMREWKHFKLCFIQTYSDFWLGKLWQILLNIFSTSEVKEHVDVGPCYTLRATDALLPTRQNCPSQLGLQQHLPVGVQRPFLQCLEQAVISSSGGSTWCWHSLGV